MAQKKKVKNIGLKVIDVTLSRLPGGKGTREFFIRISKNPSMNIKRFDNKILKNKHLHP